jgi:hypothetical protein
MRKRLKSVDYRFQSVEGGLQEVQRIVSPKKKFQNGKNEENTFREKPL